MTTYKAAKGGTQLFAGTPPTGSQSHARLKPADGHCSACGMPPGEGPFCLQDGSLVRGPFVVGGRYLVEEVLGSGGSALVFGARHRVLEKPVALKILRHEHASEPQAAQRFFREARNASKLQHPNIVGVLDFGDDEELDLRYLVMERVRGPTLSEMMAASGALPACQVVSILLQAVRALAYAHVQGLLHRDLNPRNIMLEQSSGRDDLVKLCDFGLSRLTEGDERVTVSGQMVGTPAYMAPEQIRGDEGQDGRVDLYALGATAYEMLTCRLPHEGATPVALLANKLHEPAESLRARCPSIEVPEALEEAIMRCLATDPEERPASAEELEQMLEAAGQEATGATASGQGNPSDGVDLIGRMAGAYRLTQEIGVGGLGTVYRAEHPLIGTEAAVKVLHPEVATSSDVVDRFIQEARSSSSIGNPHIPRYFDFGRFDDGRPYAVMEYFEGETVEQRLERRGPIDLGETVSILRQTASALEAAHDAGIVHRDIKPENLFLCRDKDGRETVKVLDFGIAKALSGGASAKRTQAGLFMGTPWYCAPEQAMAADIGPPADVYALGVTAFEMLTGRLPFEGDVQDVFSKKMQGEAPSVRSYRPELPEAVERTLERMVAREPARRMASMDEVLDALEGWTVSGGPSPAVTGARWIPSRPGRRVVIGLAALLVTMAVVAGWMLAGGEESVAPSPAVAEPAPTAAPGDEPAVDEPAVDELPEGVAIDEVPAPEDPAAEAVEEPVPERRGNAKPAAEATPSTRAARRRPRQPDVERRSVPAEPTGRRSAPSRDRAGSAPARVRRRAREAPPRRKAPDPEPARNERRPVIADPFQ